MLPYRHDVRCQRPEAPRLQRREKLSGVTTTSQVPKAALPSPFCIIARGVSEFPILEISLISSTADQPDHLLIKGSLSLV